MVSPACQCGWRRQDVKHIIIFCPIEYNQIIMIIKGIIGYVCRWHYDSPSSASFYISTEASVAPGFYFLNLDPEDDEQKDQTMRELKILPRQAEM